MGMVFAESGSKLVKKGRDFGAALLNINETILIQAQNLLKIWINGMKKMRRGRTLFAGIKKNNSGRFVMKLESEEGVGGEGDSSLHLQIVNSRRCSLNSAVDDAAAKAVSEVG